MFRTVSITTVMAPFAGGASFAGYSFPGMAEIIVACGDSSSFDHESDWADVALGSPTYRQHSDPVEYA